MRRCSARQTVLPSGSVCRRALDARRLSGVSYYPLAETINGLYKAEVIHRLMEPLGYIPAVEAEANYHRQLVSQTAIPA